MSGEEELLDYEEEEVQEQEAVAGKSGQEKKGYVGIHATGFKELMLKPELLQAITSCGFEHPSEGELSLIVTLAKPFSRQDAYMALL